MIGIPKLMISSFGIGEAIISLKTTRRSFDTQMK